LKKLDFKVLSFEIFDLTWMSLVFLIGASIAFLLGLSLFWQWIEELISWIRFGSIDKNLIVNIEKSFLEFAPKTGLIGIDKIISFFFSELGRLLLVIILGIPSMVLGFYIEERFQEFKKVIYK